MRAVVQVVDRLVLLLPAAAVVVVELTAAPVWHARRMGRLT